MKLFQKTLSLCFTLLFLNNAKAQNYKEASEGPNANYYSIVANERAKLETKRLALVANRATGEKLEQFREESAQFERWALEWRDKIGSNGKFPNAAAGWINAMNTNPELFQNNQVSQRPGDAQAVAWTSLGPENSGTLNGWTFGGGVGRINVVKRDLSNPSVLFAGSAAGGLFKSTNLGTSWVPITDNFAGLGVSDIALHPTSSQIMFMATGDYDGNHINSVGIFKSTNGGATWVNKLPLTLSQERRIAHLYVDPDFATNNTIWATGTNDIYKSTDGGETWPSVFNNGSNNNFNDIVKVGTGAAARYIVSGYFGRLFKSVDETGSMPDASSSFTNIYTQPSNVGRVDFSYSPNTPDKLYILVSANPAFAVYTISTNIMGTFSNITNSTPADDNGDYNAQGSYNQVITANPFNGNEIIIGEFSGKRSTNGGATWTNFLNGYYETSGNANWGGGYVHSDHHYIEFISADSILNGNDGGVYLGNTSNVSGFKECFNGLVTTQSYSISIFDAEPKNMMIGNQDNDGRSRVFDVASNTSTWYGAQAGDGISTAIHRTNNQVRYLSGTKGSLAYRTDGYTGNYSGTGIAKPNNGPFAAPIEMHLTNGDYLYGGFSDVYKLTNSSPWTTPGAWTNLNSGIGDKPKFIALANHPTDATKQRIVAIGENNTIRKSTDESTWTTVNPPSGINFNSIYWSKNSDTMLATVAAYDAANKIYFSTNAGGTWTNITDNMPNIINYNIIRYEGSDTVFVATELGVFFARLAAAGGVQRPNGIGWTKYSTGLPNVRVSDMEISYAKKQLFVSTFGRGVWTADLNNAAALPINNVDFTYKSTNTVGRYNLSWIIDDQENQLAVLEKSNDGRNFEEVSRFNDGTKNNQPAFPVEVSTNQKVYYRIYYVKPSGQKLYSQVIFIQNKKDAISITVYPNPVQGYINVNSNSKIEAVRIFTLDGKQITYSKPNSNFYSFDMSLLSAGIYLIKVSDEKGNQYTEKVVNQ